MRRPVTLLPLNAIARPANRAFKLTPMPRPAPIAKSTGTTSATTEPVTIVKGASSKAPLVGSNVTFTVSVKNNRPIDATDVVVVDALPDGYSYVSSDASVGTYD